MPVPAYPESDIIDRFNRVQAGLNRGKAILQNGLIEARAMFDQTNADANAINDFIEDYYDSAYGIIQQAIIDLCEIGNVVAPTMTKGTDWTWSRMARASTPDVRVAWENAGGVSPTITAAGGISVFGTDLDANSLWFDNDEVRITKCGAVLKSAAVAGAIVGQTLALRPIAAATADEAVNSSGVLHFDAPSTTDYYDSAYVQTNAPIRDESFEIRLTSKA